MLEIKTTGVEDYLDGSANIKVLVIGGPGAGKTRMSSFWPRPIYLDCENSRGSLVDRRMPYAEIRSSKDMLDALEYLKSLERTPKPERKFQTVVVDTVDSFQRLVKDEWLADNKAGVFTGYDAWGYLDSKMGMLLTRLLNLDYNVIVLVHYKEKRSEDAKEYGLQLQGSTAETIFNDFGLVGWLGTYWEAEGGQRVQKRGLTFKPTPDKDFLKDRFNVTPTWLPITLTSEQDYQQIWEAFFNRPEFEEFEESQVVDHIPDSEGKVVDGPVATPQDNPGGPVPPRPPVEVPLDKKLKGELLTIAKEQYGLDLPQNTLKNEILAAIEQAKAAPAPAPVAPEPPAPTDSGVPAATSPEEAPSGEAGTTTSPEAGTPDPSSSPEVAPADAAAASPESASEDTTSGTPDDSPAQPVGEQMTTEQVAEALGGTVISEEQHDTPPAQPPTPPPAPAPAAPKAPQGPEVCADCGDDLTAEWNDPSKRDYVRLGFVKHRRYLDEKCRNKANGH